MSLQQKAFFKLLFTSWAVSWYSPKKTPENPQTPANQIMKYEN